VKQPSYLTVLEHLFDKAKAKDEFEFAFTLMRFQGVQDAGWDALKEADYLYQDVVGLLQSPIKQETKVRLALLLYGHITEIDAVHLVIHNMLRVIAGERYSAFPFQSLVRKRKNSFLDSVPPSSKAKVKFIRDYAETLGESEIIAVLDEVYNEALRNAFFHSDYILYNNELRSHNSWFEHANNTRSQVMTGQELQDQLNAAINFFQAFMRIYIRSIRSYKENKRVTGRFGQNGEVVPMMLLGDKKYGLHGVKSIE
jgi:hypothetical protein